MNEIADQEGYTKQYLPTAQKTLKDHGGVWQQDRERMWTALYQRVAL